MVNLSVIHRLYLFLFIVTYDLAYVSIYYQFFFKVRLKPDRTRNLNFQKQKKGTPSLCSKGGRFNYFKAELMKKWSNDLGM